MDREIVLLALGGVLIGAAVPIGALIISAFSNDPDVSLPGCRFERTAATRLLLPLVPALLAGSMLTGGTSLLRHRRRHQPNPWRLALRPV